MRFTIILIAILIGFTNVFINFRIGSISYVRLLSLCFFFLFFKSYLSELKTNSFFKTFNIFIAVLAIIQVVVNLKLSIMEGVEFKPVLIGLIKNLSFVAFTFLAILIAKKDLKFINYIIYAHLIILVFALLQHPHSPISSNIMEFKRLLFVNPAEHVTRKLLNQETFIRHGMASKFRLSGPFSSPISLAYLLFSSFCLNVYMHFKLNKRFYFYTASFVLFISILTQTRSLVLAEGIIILGLLIYNYSKRRNLYKIIFFTVILSFTLFQLSKQNTDDQNRLSNYQSDSRPLLWYTGFYTVLSHPLGVTDKQHDDIQDKMAIRLENHHVKELSTHNGFINIGFNYSIFGYLIVTLFFIFLLKKTNQLEPQYKILFNLFFLGYFLHSSFHNVFIFIDDYYILLIVVILNLQLGSNTNTLNHLNE
ncbi:MAG: O-antigen ligase family protein [Arcobacter sp.]|nr:O-antigen ligase family protein [Arcobacter sp.]